MSVKFAVIIMLRRALRQVPTVLGRNPFQKAPAFHFSTTTETLFQGILTKEVVDKLEFKESFTGIPVLRYLDYDGNLIKGMNMPFSETQAVQMMETMITLTVYDKMFYEIQRQGRISFYMTSTGEEALMIGSGFALDKNDTLFTQYRELGVLLSRGFNLDDILNQIFATGEEPGKGRQMPIHYTSKKINLQTVSSPLCTQVPQAAGAGYAYKVKGEKNVAVCYFGEGAASEGDFTSGLNFASTLGAQTLFICRNNGLAISTPVNEQYRGDGIAIRGIAYGIPSIRVDGNDAIATYIAVKEAREMIIQTGRPALVELMSYRLGHHSTSDDASRYRSDEDAKMWTEEGVSGIGRFRRFLVAKGLWSEKQEKDLISSVRKEVLKGIKDSETNRFSASIENIFTDVLATRDGDETNTKDGFGDYRLSEQMDELKDHLKLHMNKYRDLKRYRSSQDFDIESLVEQSNSNPQLKDHIDQH